MFEDVRKEDDKTVSNAAPAPVNDPYDTVDPTPDIASALKQGKLRAVPPLSEQAPSASGGAVQPQHASQAVARLEEWSTRRSRRGVIISVILILVFGIGGGAGAAYYFFARSAAVPVFEDQDSKNTNKAPAAPTNTLSNGSQPGTTSPAVPPASLIDADGDGLTDAEEQAAGTDPDDSDTDDDGLADRDEQRVHKTNPLNADSDNDGLTDRAELYEWNTNPSIADTDGDTHLDGAEVANGYDPNGSGKLAPRNVNSGSVPKVMQ